MHGKKCPELLAIVFLITLATTAFGQVAVSIEAQDHRDYFFPDETRIFEVTAINTTDTVLLGEKFKAQTSDELALIENNRFVSEQTSLVPEIPSRQAIVLRFLVKAKTNPTDKATIAVNSGLATYNQVAAIQNRIVPLPFTLKAESSSSQMGLGETNAIQLSGQNDSNQPITNFSSNLELSNGFVELSPQTVQIERLDINQAIPTTSFDFQPKGTMIGFFDATLITTFEDTNGFHRIVTRHTIEIQDRSTGIFLLFLLAVIAVWLSYSLLSKNKKADPKEKKK